MPTIITLLAIVIVFLMFIVWVICVASFIKIIGKAIRKNDELVADDQEDTDKHPWINGDCCRCAECVDIFHKELLATDDGKRGSIAFSSTYKEKMDITEPYGDTETLTEINHNLRNNR